jgi:hypothetical protein
LNTSIDIADVLALITVAGIAVYVAGLVGLAIAIRLEFTRDLSTAWYVVALIPRTVVAGQGVRIWLVWPVSLAVLLLLTGLAGLMVGRPNFARLIPAMGLLFACVLSALVLRSARRAQRPMDSAWGTRHLVAVAAIASLVGSILVSKGVHIVFLIAIGAENLVPETIGRSLVVGAILYVVGGFLVALPGAVVIPDPLPAVRIYRGPDVACLDGHLVSHADGFWYLMVGDANAHKELQTIPDAKVAEVRTIGENEIGSNKAAPPEAGPEHDTKLREERPR